MKPLIHFYLTSLLACIISFPALAEGELQMASLGQCELESSEFIEDCRLGYRTFGTLNDKRSNALLFLTFYTGTTESYINIGAIGPGKLADTSRFFVIAIGALGNGVSSSPSNSPTQANADFPGITIGDMVDTQYRLLNEELDVSHVHAIMGISMGGMQAYEWAVRYPEFVDYAIPISGTPRQTSYDILLWNTHLETINSFADVNYESAVRVITGLGQLTVYTPTRVATRIPLDEYEDFMARNVANTKDFGLANRVPQLRAMIAHDISESFGGSMETAAAAIHAQMLVIVSPTDHLVNPLPSREFVAIRGAEILEMEGTCGHVAAICELDSVAAAVNAFLPDPE